jgi:hypothetical protein
MKYFAYLIFVFLMQGCASTGAFSKTGIGVLYTATADSVAVSSGQNSEKIGRACNYNILGLVAVGDGSVYAAKKNVDIKNVASVDVYYENILGVYGRACTIVHGN